MPPSCAAPPLPDPPPLGAGTRLLPPAGGGWKGGRTLRAMVTAAVHAAAPHPDGMTIVPGRASPSHTLPPGGRMGQPGFPLPLRAGQALPRAGAWETRFPHPSA